METEVDRDSMSMPTNEPDTPHGNEAKLEPPLEVLADAVSELEPEVERDVAANSMPSGQAVCERYATGEHRT